MESLIINRILQSFKVPLPKILANYKNKKGNFPAEELSKQPLSQATKVAPTRSGQTESGNCLTGHGRGENRASQVTLLPRPEPDHEETPGKSKPKGILPINWPVMVNNVKLMCVKETLMKHSRLGEPGETGQPNSMPDPETLVDPFL